MLKGKPRFPCGKGVPHHLPLEAPACVSLCPVGPSGSPSCLKPSKAVSRIGVSSSLLCKVILPLWVSPGTCASAFPHALSSPLPPAKPALSCLLRHICRLVSGAGVGWFGPGCPRSVCPVNVGVGESTNPSSDPGHLETAVPFSPPPALEGGGCAVQEF